MPSSHKNLKSFFYTNMRVFISYFLLSILVVGAKASLKEAVVEATKEAPEACSLDVLACADGSVLDRDPNMDCQFPRCSCKNSDQCMRGECVEGTCRGGSDDDADDDEVDDGYTDDYYTNDDEKGDDYEPAACTQDVRQCRDGSSVGRISPYCEFEACPCYENRDCYQGEICEEEKCVEEDKGEICSSDVLECLDGSTVSRIPPACKFDRCSCRNSRDCRRGICFDGKCSDRSVQCTLDVRECDDGSFVGRVPPDW